MTGNKWLSLTCPEFELPEAMNGPTFSMLLRQEPRFSADFVINGMSTTFLEFALDINSEVIESTAEREVT